MRQAIHGKRLRGREREAALAKARQWYADHKAEFDAMDAAGMFSDSVPQEWPISRSAAR